MFGNGDEKYQNNDIFESINVNPLVLIAWRCKHLYKLVIHGEYF